MVWCAACQIIALGHYAYGGHMVDMIWDYDTADSFKVSMILTDMIWDMILNVFVHDTMLHDMRYMIECLHA